MILLPALDLLNGQVVRLRQGDYREQTIYAHAGIELIVQWMQSGANELHLVDLSGAKDPSKRQTAWIRQLVKSTSARVQTGGGIRSLQDACELREAGVDRVIVSSLAVKNPAVTQEILRELGPDHLVLAADTRRIGDQWKVQIAGWQESTEDLFQFLQVWIDRGVKTVLCTDVSKDGMLQGPNLKLYQEILTHFPGLQLQASGGVSSLQDLSQLSALGVSHAITGKALLEGRFTIEEALRVC